MQKQKIYDFLADLAANNSKDWMHANKKRYQEAKGIFLEEVTLLLDRFKQHSPEFEQVDPRKALLRITNNRRFHPNKPLYRDNFGFAPVSDMTKPAFYLHVSPKETFIGGGLYKPMGAVLKKIREGIDYDGDRLKGIVRSSAFTNLFGGLDDDPDQLKSAPRGYTVDHPHIDLLRRRSFTAIRPLTQAEFLSDHFLDLAEQAFLTLQPLNAYLRQAAEFEE
jgi:uncharacterized protein (TIGR02453 family)